MELKDTVNDMCSEDYKKRFKAEYHQLKTRHKNLEYMLSQLNTGQLKFKPNSPVSILSSQEAYMRGYLSCLEVRAAAEGITL